MTNMFIGQVAAILTAFCWAIGSTNFEKAGKKIGSVNLNLMRLVFAFAFSCIYTFFSRGYMLPADASGTIWFWLVISGFTGMFIGDLLLFEAFVTVGARISMLIYACVPIFSTILAYVFLKETMTIRQIAGMLITISGIAIAILDSDNSRRKVKFSHPIAGILFALGGAIAQAIGYVIGKYGMGGYDAFAATQIRILSGIIGFAVFFTFKKQWKSFFLSFRQTDAVKPAIIASFFGPFIGVSLSLFAVQRVNPGIASTLMSITPVILIFYAIIFKGEKIRVKEIIGSILCIIGLGIIFI